jgi:hypothetical protein
MATAVAPSVAEILAKLNIVAPAAAATTASASASASAVATAAKAPLLSSLSTAEASYLALLKASLKSPVKLAGVGGIGGVTVLCHFIGMFFPCLACFLVRFLMMVAVVFAVTCVLLNNKTHAACGHALFLDVVKFALVPTLVYAAASLSSGFVPVVGFLVGIVAGLAAYTLILPISERALASRDCHANTQKTWLALWL